MVLTTATPNVRKCMMYNPPFIWRKRIEIQASYIKLWSRLGERGQVVTLPHRRILESATSPSICLSIQYTHQYSHHRHCNRPASGSWRSIWCWPMWRDRKSVTIVFWRLGLLQNINQYNLVTIQVPHTIEKVEFSAKVVNVLFYFIAYMLSNITPTLILQTRGVLSRICTCCGS